jgi:hypothetical protein
MHACINEERKSDGITIVPLEANQSDPLRVNAKSLRSLVRARRAEASSP